MKYLPLLPLLPFLFFAGCQGIGPNGPNTATAGLDPGTLINVASLMAGKEAEKRYGINPFELLGGGAVAVNQDSVSFTELGAVFSFYEAGRTNASMRDLFQILYQQKHPPMVPVAAPFAP